MALFAWHSYLNGSILSAIIALSLTAGVILGMASHPLERHFSADKQAGPDGAERSKFAEIKNNSYEPKIDKTDKCLFTPEEVKKRLNQLLESKS